MFQKYPQHSNKGIQDMNNRFMYILHLYTEEIHEFLCYLLSLTVALRQYTADAIALFKKIKGKFLTAGQKLTALVHVS